MRSKSKIPKWIWLTLAAGSILFSILAIRFPEYRAAARKSEARIAMTAIAGSERSYFSEYKKYVPNFESVGYAPEGTRRIYSLAIVTCTGSSKDMPVFSFAAGDGVNGSPVRSALQDRINKEQCANREAGFAIFAATMTGTVANPAVEVLRIDETEKPGSAL